MYFGDEVQKLKDQGTKIYSFDLKQNSVPNAFSTHKKLNQSANISRMRNKGAHGKNLNRSVIGRIGTSKIEEGKSRIKLQRDLIFSYTLFIT